MKKLIIAAGLLLVSQALIAQKTSQKKHESAYAGFVYVSPNMDTLYLTENNPISEMTRSAWASDPKWTGSNPTIIMLPQSEIDRKKSNKNK